MEMERKVLKSKLSEIKSDVERILKQPRKEQKHLVGAVLRKIEDLMKEVVI